MLRPLLKSAGLLFCILSVSVAARGDDKKKDDQPPRPQMVPVPIPVPYPIHHHHHHPVVLPASGGPSGWHPADHGWQESQDAPGVAFDPRGLPRDYEITHHPVRGWGRRRPISSSQSSQYASSNPYGSYDNHGSEVYGSPYDRHQQEVGYPSDHHPFVPERAYGPSSEHRYSKQVRNFDEYGNDGGGRFEPVDAVVPVGKKPASFQMSNTVSQQDH